MENDRVETKIDRLRTALAIHDDWPTDQTRDDVVDAARAAMREHDSWQEARRAMLKWPNPF